VREGPARGASSQKALFDPLNSLFLRILPCMVGQSRERRGAARAADSSEETMAAKKTAAAAGGAKKSMSKSGLIQAIAEAVGDELTRKQVRSVLESLITVGHRELKKSGVFTLPGFAKFRVVKKPATKARQGINPFTKQPQTFAAKPASKSVRARPIKAIKDALA
jgi:nucleoid DNA-binding protein